MDVVSIHQRSGPQWKLDLPRGIPPTLTDFFADKATYVFDVLIAADNARPRRHVSVKFTYDPQSNELSPKPVNKVRYPWWAFWRWPPRWKVWLQALTR